ncbi:VOC family protein [Microbacterium flavum]|uniref:VOC family protein n=1 Tax=Microbacterium flavum TaxID=415216 RepID=UPI0027E088CA|nr:VOC family protein [Microbacterium flavum]
MSSTTRSPGSSTSSRSRAARRPCRDRRRLDRHPRHRPCAADGLLDARPGLRPPRRPRRGLRGAAPAHRARAGHLAGCRPLAADTPPRIHLDLYAEDQDAEVARLIGLGAARVHWDRQPPGSDYVIMEDPEGNRFCVVAAPGWAGWAAHR